MMEKQMLRMERLSSNLEDSDLHFHDRSALKPHMAAVGVIQSAAWWS